MKRNIVFSAAAGVLVATSVLMLMGQGGIPCLQGNDCVLGPGTTVGGVVPGASPCVNDWTGNTICTQGGRVVILDGGGVIANWPNGAELGQGPFQSGYSVPLLGPPNTLEWLRMTNDPLDNKAGAITVNAWPDNNAGRWNQDDNSTDSWVFEFNNNTDRMRVSQINPGGHTEVLLLNLDPTGNMTLPLGSVSAVNFVGVTPVSFGTYKADFSGLVTSGTIFGPWFVTATAGAAARMSTCQTVYHTAGTGVAGTITIVDETSVSTLCTPWAGNFDCSTAGAVQAANGVCSSLTTPGHLYASVMTGCTTFPHDLELQCDLTH
jgi:hypothetical protein